MRCRAGRSSSRPLLVGLVMSVTAIRMTNAAEEPARSQPGAGLRVLFVTNLWPDEERPWHGTYVRSQAASLERLGVEIDVVALRGYASRSEYARGMRAALGRSRQRSHDVVHAHYGHAAAVARVQLGTPLVISYCGSDLLGEHTASGVSLSSRVELAVFRQLARVAAATITKSAAMEDVLPRPARARNHVIPNGVDLERFAPRPRARARAQLGWDPGQPVALFAGNPDLAVKNVDLARAACALVPGVRLHVAFGQDPALMPVLMSAADVLLAPSRSEGSPNVVKEAMAAELPVVATAVGDVPERLAGVPGCTACPPDAAALAAGLRAAIEHGRCPEARAAVAPLGLRAVAERVLAVYAAVT